MHVYTVKGRVLGIDYGERRMGVAISDETRTVATPLAVIAYDSIKEACREVEQYRSETSAEEIVVGMPISLGGFHGDSAKRVGEFIENLSRFVSVPIVTWDERFSTVSANQALIEGGARRVKRKQVVDKLAAQIMLQHYLDSR